MRLSKIFVFILSFVLESVANKNSQSKRFLIDSTDTSGSRLTRVESNQLILTRMVSRLNSTVTEILTRNTLLDNADKLQDNLIHQLQNTVSDLHTANIRQQAVINNIQDALPHAVTQMVAKSTENPITNASEMGSTFVRWGKRRCPIGDHIEMVYGGYGGAQWYNARGGPAGMLCMPEDPEISNTTSTIGYSYIYGMEYSETTFKSDADNEDVPCVLCRNKHAYASVMIPGRVTCYSGWKREYYGYLSSGATSHSSSDYICVDINPDFTPGGKDEKNGKLLYVSSPVCGSLPCPPYKQGIPLFCVVCSK